MSINGSHLPDSRYNTVPGYNQANNYGPAQPLDHSGMSNRAFDQFHEDIMERAAQRRPKVDGPFKQILKKLFCFK